MGLFRKYEAFYKKTFMEYMYMYIWNIYGRGLGCQCFGSKGPEDF